MKKKTNRRKTIYASLYEMDDNRLKAHLIFIVGKNGKLEDYYPGPFNIGEYFGQRLKKKEAGMVVCSYLKLEHPHMKLRPEDVKLYPYTKANEMLFRLENV